jgi:acetyltransferase-like isoleucine patch superfamily enzyme
VSTLRDAAPCCRLGASLITRGIKQAVKKLVWGPPHETRAGEASYMYRPRRIDGAKYIEFGARTTIDRFGWLSALDSYAGIKYRPEIRIGDDVHIGRYACLTSINSIVIEDGCLLSEHVYISDLAHGLDPEGGLFVNQPLSSKGPVRIGAYSFIGYRVCIMPGVSLGKHSVVGANSVVTRSFSGYSMIAGAPAKLVKTYSPTSREWVAISESVHD